MMKIETVETSRVSQYDASGNMADATETRDKQEKVSAAGRRLRAQGHRTRELVVQEAKKLLLEGGSLEFTLRTVARRAHISISNLQYYFPTRASLLRAIMEPIITQYRIELSQGGTDPKSARQSLGRLIDQTLSDVRSPETSAIWLHFASLAVTDPESARILDESYGFLTREVGRLARIINPALSTADSHLFARLLAGLLDGLTFQIGAGHRPKSVSSNIDARIHAIVNLMLDKFPQQPRPTR